MKRFAIFSALALAACAPPAVVDYNGDSVRIQSNFDKPNQDVLNEAQRICRDRGMSAEYASSRTIPGAWDTVHLFLCMHNPKSNAGLPSSVAAHPRYLETTSSL